MHQGYLFGKILLVAEFFKRIYGGLFGPQTISLFPVSLRHETSAGERAIKFRDARLEKRD